MKFLHMADLHLGRRFDDISLLNEQRYVLRQAVEAAEKVDCVLICGDIYDSSHPDKEAVALFNWFISQLSEMKKKVFIISGNHDGENMFEAFSHVLEDRDIYISHDFNGKLQSYYFYDEFSNRIGIHLLPYVNCSKVRKFYPERNLENCDDAVRAVIENSDIDSSAFNIILSHQLIRYAQQCDSEELSDAEREYVDAASYNRFDYVAMGHLHRAQFIGRDTFRYAGSIYKYSFSETDHQKSFVIFETDEEKKCSLSSVAIDLLNNVEIIEGKYEELIKTDFNNSYVHIILTDEQMMPQAREMLLDKYPNMLRLSMKKSSEAEKTDKAFSRESEKKSIDALFVDFYKFKNNGEEPDEYMMYLLRNAINEKGGH